MTDELFDEFYLLLRNLHAVESALRSLHDIIPDGSISEIGLREICRKVTKWSDSLYEQVEEFKSVNEDTTDEGL